MMFCSWGGGGGGAKGIDIEVEIWRAFYGMMFRSCMGVAKQGINLLFNQKRKLGLQSIKRLKIDRIVAENSIMVSISPFKILLNNLNSELDQRNLESLVHVC